MQTEEIKSFAPSFIPTLLVHEPDGYFLLAYCPHCNKVEKARVEYAGQPRDNVASVQKIRDHLQLRHRRELRTAAA